MPSTRNRTKKRAKARRSDRLSAQSGAELKASNMLLTQQAAVAEQWIDQASANTKQEIQALQNRLCGSADDNFSFTVRGTGFAPSEESSAR